MLHLRRWILGLLSTSLLACSPALNWREVRFEADVPMQLLIPCKPDRAERSVSMAGSDVALQMLGCNAAGATFAVSHVHVADAASAFELLRGWRAAVLAHVRAHSLSDLAWAPSARWPALQAQRVQAQGFGPDGQPVAIAAMWFGVASPAGIDLFHAVMFSPRPQPAIAETFFAGFAHAP